MNFVLQSHLKPPSTEHRSIGMEDGDEVFETEPYDLPPTESQPSTPLGDSPMSKTLALAAAAAAVALGSSFTGTTSAEAGYHHKHYGHGYAYKRVVYKPVYVYKRVYKPVYVYKPAYVYRKVHTYGYGH